MLQEMMPVTPPPSDNSIELLWTLPNATTVTTFANQTINESSDGWESGKRIADYDYFLIQSAGTCEYARMLASGSGNLLPSLVRLLQYISKGISEVYVSFGGSASSGVGAITWARQLTVSDSGFVFGQGMRWSGSSSTGTANNTFACPMRIWGVRGQLDYLGK